MLTQGIHRNRTSREVTFLDAANDADEALLTEAMRLTGENKSSLFGTDVRRYADGGAIVTLHTD